MIHTSTLFRHEALEALKKRRSANQNKIRISNEDLPAGSPMYFYCISCAAELKVPENFIVRPRLCEDCKELKKMGWLE